MAAKDPHDADDREFFRAEVERLTDRLYGVALRLTGNRATAEDLVSETVLKAWSNLSRLNDRQAFPKWILRILTNTYISEHCRGCREEPAPADPHDEDRFSLFEQIHQPFLLWWSNPEHELHNKLLRRDIEAALAQLPEAFRVVVVLVEIEDCSYAETAEALAVPVGTVRSRLNRARSMMQRALWEQAKEAGLLDSSQDEEERV